MSATLHLSGYDLDVPVEPFTFDRFRSWTLSDSFPEKGRIDYLGSRVDVDMSPESLYTHGNVKTEVASVLKAWAKRDDSGEVFSDQTRVVEPEVGLSSNPDVLFLSDEAVESGRVVLTPKAERPNDAVEIVGPPDLVVEIVSDSSVSKDTRDLYSLYFDAGVREYWLIDARGAEISFRLLTRGPSGWREAIPDSEGFRLSLVLRRQYRLVRKAGRRGEWRYDLIEREPS